jgi:hypothetical protein
MTLREQVVRELIDSVGIETISHMADRILALVKDDARRREREAFVEGVRWEMGNPAGLTRNRRVEAAGATRRR